MVQRPSLDCTVYGAEQPVIQWSHYLEPLSPIHWSVGQPEYTQWLYINVIVHWVHICALSWIAVYTHTVTNKQYTMHSLVFRFTTAACSQCSNITVVTTFLRMRLIKVWHVLLFSACVHCGSGKANTSSQIRFPVFYIAITSYKLCVDVISVLSTHVTAPLKHTLNAIQ